MTRPGDPGHRWKRADVTTSMLLHAIDRFGVGALDVLHTTQGIPVKVLVSAVVRDSRRKLVTWGVSVWRPFLDTAGQRIVEEAKAVRRVNSQGGRGRAVHMNEWSHTIENGMIVHSQGNSSTSHGATTRCGKCPPVVPAATQAGTWKVVAELVGGGPTERHEVSGTPDVVAQWLRALAERAAPTRPVKRGVRDTMPEDWSSRGDVAQGFNILPPPRP